MKVPSTQWSRFALHNQTIRDIDEVIRHHNDEAKEVVEERCPSAIRDGAFTVRDVVLVGEALRKHPDVGREFEDSMHNDDKQTDETRIDLAKGYAGTAAVLEVYEDAEEH